MTLYVGEGLRRSNGARFTLLWISIFHSTTHNQIGPLWCWLPSGWACAHSRPPWVSPMTSPVRLGVSPAAAPTPKGTFNQRSEALFPRAGALGYRVCFTTLLFFPVYLCASVGPQGTTRSSVCPVLRHSESGPLGLSVRKCGATGSANGLTACPISPTLWPVSVPPRQLESSPPWLPVSAPPTSLDECFLFPWCRTSLPFDFLSVLVVRGGAVCLPTPPYWFS